MVRELELSAANIKLEEIIACDFANFYVCLLLEGAITISRMHCVPAENASPLEDDHA